MANAAIRAFRQTCKPAPKPSAATLAELGIVWRRRTGLAGMAHAFEGEVPLCGGACAEPGSPSVFFHGRPVRPFEDTEVSPYGTPYGRFCKHCDTAVRRRREGRL